MLLSDHQLRTIVANIIYYTLKAQVEKINDGDIIVHDLCVIFPLIVNTLKKINVDKKCAKMLMLNILFGKSELDMKDCITNLYHDVEDFCVDLFSGQPPELKTSSNIDVGILLVIIDLTKKNIVEKSVVVKTRHQMVEEILKNISDKNFAKEIIIHLKEVDDNFIRTLYHKTAEERIDLLQEWMPTEQLNEFFDVVKKDTEPMREEYASTICDLYKKMNKKFDARKKEKYTTTYYVKNVLPVIRLARKNYLVKHNLPEEDEFTSYEMHIKFLKLSTPTESTKTEKNTEPQMVSFSILCHNKPAVQFKAETNSKFTKIVQQYCSKLNLLANKTRFIFDGTIDPEKTISELKISNISYVLCDYSE
jgi:hypothetical protein